jgi:hypothetical protein
MSRTCVQLDSNFSTFGTCQRKPCYSDLRVHISGMSTLLLCAFQLRLETFFLENSLVILSLEWKLGTIFFPQFHGVSQFIEHFIISKLTGKFPPFTESEGSLLFSQKLYPEPSYSFVHLHSLFL